VSDVFFCVSVFDPEAQGNDYVNIFVRPTASPLSKVAMDSGAGDGRLPDEIKYVKFSTISWTEDAKGFFYQVGLPPSMDIHKF
jgi:hypothetical protein